MEKMVAIKLMDLENFGANLVRCLEPACTSCILRPANFCRTPVNLFIRTHVVCTARQSLHSTSLSLLHCHRTTAASFSMSFLNLSLSGCFTHQHCTQGSHHCVSIHTSSRRKAWHNTGMMLACGTFCLSRPYNTWLFIKLMPKDVNFSFLQAIVPGQPAIMLGFLLN